MSHFPCIQLQAEKEWAWCEREMSAAAKALGFDGPSAWTDALEAVSADHVPPGEQPDVIKRLAEEAIEFLEEHDLVTIPPLAKVLLYCSCFVDCRRPFCVCQRTPRTFHLHLPAAFADVSLLPPCNTRRKVGGWR
eukprot:COSAG02_NODE_3314_length_6953_cov_4.605924_6_plen_135_part_00